MNRCFLGMGSNIGDRYKYLEQGITLLNDHPSIHLNNKSSVYETEPYGYIQQSNFLNMVIEIETNLTPEDLLKYIHVVEKKLDRERKIHWGPRTIDIDILLYENQVIRTEELQVPHLYLTKRLFALLPLSDLYTGFIPGETLTVGEYIERLDDQKEGINKWKE